MIRFFKLHIEGFCSIGKFELNLDQGCILIKAPNGNGKSTLFSALVWVLYGKNLKGNSDVKTWKSIMPKDYRGVLVSITYRSKQGIFKVIRCQDYKGTLEDGAKGNNRLLVYQEGQLIDVKGKNPTQEFINKSLEMSYGLFMSSCVFGQGLKRLIQETNSDKKKIFEEIFDVSFINKAREIANEDKQGIREEVSNLEHEKSSLEKEIRSISETYEDLKDREKHFKREIKKAVDELTEERLELTKELQDLNKKMKDEVCLTLDSKINRQNKYILSTQEAIREAKKLSNVSLEDFIKDIIKLLLDHKYKKALGALRRVSEAFKNLTLYQEDLEVHRERLGKLQHIKWEYEKIESKSKRLASEIVNIDTRIKKLQSKTLEKGTHQKYKVKLSKLKEKLPKLQSLLDEAKGKLSNYDWLLNDPLSNSGIKAYLFESNLSSINNVLDTYSNILGFHIEFGIDLNSARKDFYTLIEKDGSIIEYEDLSGGEKQLVNLAMAFAMNESVSSSKGVNIAFLDEVFESLSSDNIELVVSLIKEVFKGKNLFLITHHESLPLSNYKTLSVEKVKGLSQYKLL